MHAAQYEDNQEKIEEPGFSIIKWPNYSVGAGLKPAPTKNVGSSQ
jgi:hypothetical protein